jgi:hypothetical protein
LEEKIKKNIKNMENMEMRAAIQFIRVDKTIKLSPEDRISKKIPYLTEDFLLQLVRSLEKLLFWDRLCYLEKRYSDGKYVSIKDRDMLRKEIIKSVKKHKSFDVSTSDSSQIEASSVLVLFNELDFSVIFIISSNHYQGQEKAIIPNLLAVMLEIMEQSPGIEKIEGDLNISILSDFPFYKKRPPHYAVHWGYKDLVNILDWRYLTNNPRRNWAEIREGIKHVPDFVVVEERGPFTILKWIDDLSDLSKVAERLTARNIWIHEHLNLEIASGFNEYGDVARYDLRYYQQYAYGTPTYYGFTHDKNNDERVYFGYQAMVVMPDGSTDEVLLQQLASSLKTKTLPDGNPIHVMSLIVQDRDAALLLSERAKSLGFTRVLYMDDNTDFWDVDAPGLWLD